MNTQHSPGEHWVAVHKGKTKTLFYDSFGRDPEELFPNISKKITSTEQDAEQRVEQTDCGQRCLAFLLICSIYGEEIAQMV